ncbi:hypothetical protein SAMN02745166_05168 [Prosthecobacter debontii]|uniref:Uncharacterized protein n=1 Tax=Prosthecobacter debontii TaxID=48467 RepID=A0A1T4Z6G7_9BACT|nr:hypothetical protein SAMN02745166_05168 [Prosthecobacter debontii]
MVAFTIATIHNTELLNPAYRLVLDDWIYRVIDSLDFLQIVFNYFCKIIFLKKKRLLFVVAILSNFSYLSLTGKCVILRI